MAGSSAQQRASRMSMEGSTRLAGKSFAEQVRTFSEKTKITMPTVIKKLALDMYTGIIMLTPVDTGRARANWMMSVGSPNENITENVDKQGSSTIAAGMNNIVEYQGDQSIFITNNLPYIVPLEYGHSGKAPQGMVRLTVARFRNAMARITAGL